MDNHSTIIAKIWQEKINQVLFLSVCFSLIIIAFRIQKTGSIGYVFLIWNLFLATIPYVITQCLRQLKWAKQSKISLLFIFGIWLLFLPNAPYIITDLIHLKTKNDTTAGMMHL